MSMKSVYIFGPIFLFGNDYIPVYKSLNELAGRYFEKVIGTYPDFWESKESPQDFYKRTYNVITRCNLFVAEVSSPSHGVGMELQMAKEHDIPVVLIVKEDIDISKSLMVLGIPNLYKIVEYRNIDDLKGKLEAEFKSFLEDRKI